MFRLLEVAITEFRDCRRSVAGPIQLYSLSRKSGVEEGSEYDAETHLKLREREGLFG